MLRSLLLLLLLPGFLQAQHTLVLSKKPNAEQVATAEATIKSAQQSPTQLAFGGYAIVDIKLEGKLRSYVVPGSDDCIKTIPILKGQSYSGWLVPAGKTQFEWVTIEPNKDIDRLLVVGTANGSATVIWHAVVNGESEIVAAFKFDVGKPRPVPPKPDDPVVPDDPLVKSFKEALNKDVLAGKGDKKWILPLAGIYEAASNDSLESMATMGDLDNVLFSARQKAGIPDPEVQLLNLRKAMQAELYQQLGVNKDSASVPFKPDTRRLAKATLLKIANALEAITQ